MLEGTSGRTIYSKMDDKKMKKILIIGLVLVMVSSGCTDKEEAPTETPAAEAPEQREWVEI